MIIGVIGAGNMGTGIAQAFAQTCQFDVLLCDTSLALAQKGKERIEAILRRQVEKNRITEQQLHDILLRVAVGTQEKCENCDWIIEAASENLKTKQSIFCALDKICKPSCLFATNTSSLSITEIGKDVKRPLVGMHFFNPASVMQLIEVIPGQQTPQTVIDKVEDLSRQLGKTPIRVQESAGFVVNRILITMINEAIGVYSNNVASAADIDLAMKLGANHPIGPLALGDMIGLDIILDIMKVIHNETHDDKYRPQPLLEQMVQEGKLGKKTKCGFYQY